MVNLYTKYHVNTSKHNKKKCGKLVRTDGRRDGRSGATLADGNAGNKSCQMTAELDYSKS